MLLPESADESVFIPLISDYGFKATFGNETNTLFLRRALQALIGSDAPIEDVEFLSNEQLGLTADGRGGIYDLACRDAHNTTFLVEMQLTEYPDFIQRMKFYALYRFNTLAKKGRFRFNEMPRIYCIGILDFVLLPHIAAYHNCATLRNQHDELIDDQTTFITVELPKFTTPENQIQTDLDKLLYTMKNLHTAPPDPIQWPEFWTEEWIQIAIDELDRRSLTPEQLLQYEMRVATNATIVYAAERRLAKAEAAGLEKGMQQGLAQGLEQGLEQGIEQGLEQGLEQGMEQGMEKGLEQGMEKGMKQGLEKGIAEAQRVIIRRALLRGKLTPEEIAEDTGAGIETVHAIQRDRDGA